MAAIISRVLLLLNKLVPASIAVKGLSKVNPKMASFVTDSLAAGYTADNVIEYLRTRLTSSGEQMEKSRLENSSSLTPQEKNNLQKRKTESGLGTAAAGAIGLATGLGGLASGEQSEEVAQPQQAQNPSKPPIPSRPLNVKPPSGGLSASGFPIPQSQPQPQNKPASPMPQNSQAQSQPQQQNVIAQYSPALYKFLSEKIASGTKPHVAAFQALDNKSLKAAARKLEQDSGMAFSDVVLSEFGSQAALQSQQARAQQAQQAGQPQAGQAMQGIMQALQLATQSRQRRQNK